MIKVVHISKSLIPQLIPVLRLHDNPRNFTTDKVKFKSLFCTQKPVESDGLIIYNG